MRGGTGTSASRAVHPDPGEFRVTIPPCPLTIRCLFNTQSAIFVLLRSVRSHTNAFRVKRPRVAISTGPADPVSRGSRAENLIFELLLFFVGCITLARMRIRLSDFLPEGFVVSAENAVLLVQAHESLLAETQCFERFTDAADDQCLSANAEE